jgi:cation transport ATPase
MGIKGIVNKKEVIIGNQNIVDEEISSDKIKMWEENGSTIVYVMINYELKAALSIHDVIRDEAPFAIKNLFK